MSKKVQSKNKSNLMSQRNFLVGIVIITLVAILFVVLVEVTFSNQTKDPVTQKSEETSLIGNEMADSLQEPEVKRERLQGLSIPSINTDKWGTYENKWYGFAFKRPGDWRLQKNQKTGQEEVWEAQYIFQSNEISSQENAQENLTTIKRGVRVLVYSAADTKADLEMERFVLKGTLSEMKDETEAKQWLQPEADEMESSFSDDGGKFCNRKNLEDYLIKDENFSAQAVYVPTDDDCFEPQLYFRLEGKHYNYILLPIDFPAQSGQAETVEQVAEIFPEFLKVASSFREIEIVRPEPKPKITAPKPVSYKKVGDRLVCGKKHDKPVRSKENNKGKIHLDMECCLDPDEIPNPHCYYDPAKYGKYLKNPHTMSENGKRSKKK